MGDAEYITAFHKIVMPVAYEVRIETALTICILLTVVKWQKCVSRKKLSSIIGFFCICKNYVIKLFVVNSIFDFIL